MMPFTAHIEGVALWSPVLADWAIARTAFRDATFTPGPAQRIPALAMLPPAERRRAPETVALALAVCAQAVNDSGHKASEVLAVFSSTHGDLPVIDDLCRTLVKTPLLVSPTRFLHSIHNAPKAYWSMLTGNVSCSTAVSASGNSFATGLLEALTLCQSEQQAVLLVAYDTAAVGSLTHTTQSQGALALALVLGPRATRQTQATVHWHISQVNDSSLVMNQVLSLAARHHAGNAMAPGLGLFEALAHQRQGRLGLMLSRHQVLHIDLEPVAADQAAAATRHLQEANRHEH